MNPHRASFSRQPLAQLAVAFSVGICLANYFSIALPVLLSVGAVFTALAVAAVVKQRLLLAGVALLLATSGAGATLALQEKRSERGSELRELAGKQLVITGVISGPVEVGRDQLYLTL